MQHYAVICSKVQRGMSVKPEDASVRVTASLTSQQDRVLRALAVKHKVSVAWLVRFAVAQLVERADTVQLSLDLAGSDAPQSRKSLGA
jgi:hypothetical protein